MRILFLAFLIRVFEVGRSTLNMSYTICWQEICDKSFALCLLALALSGKFICFVSAAAYLPWKQNWASWASNVDCRPEDSKNFLLFRTWGGGDSWMPSLMGWVDMGSSSEIGLPRCSHAGHPDKCPFGIYSFCQSSSFREPQLILHWWFKSNKTPGI